MGLSRKSKIQCCLKRGTSDLLPHSTGCRPRKEQGDFAVTAFREKLPHSQHLHASENYTWILHFHALILILRKVGLGVLLVILKWNK